MSAKEEGRRLASEREDLVASGVDPAELLVPLAPDGDLVDAEIMCAYSDVPGSPFEEAPCLGGCGGPAGTGCQRIERMVMHVREMEVHP